MSQAKPHAQLHQLQNGHWSTSVRTPQHVQIFCCTLSVKTIIIDQLLKIYLPQNTESNSDKIMFVERHENEVSTRNCCLYAIAHVVAILFDIDASRLRFKECDMRTHLTECLEDMCFSMFPLLRSSESIQKVP